MGWLGLKKGPTRKEELLEQQALEAAEPEDIPALGPALSLLVPDVAGVTSFHLLQFHSTGDAAEYLGSLPAVSGVHAFWALHEPPSLSAQADGAEAMVLIRSAEGSETVYVVSFVDLESAQSFARFEVKRGMNLSLLLIYWAEIVDIAVAESGICFSPESPPLAAPVAGHWDTTPDVQATATTTQSPPVSEPTIEDVAPPGPELTEIAPSEPAPEAAFEPETEPEPEPAAEGASLSEPELAQVDTPAPAPALEPQTEQSLPALNGSSARGTAGIDATDLAAAEPALEEVARAVQEEELDIEREARAFLDAGVPGATEAQAGEPPSEIEEAPGPEATAETIDLVPEAGAAEPELDDTAAEAGPVAEPAVEEPQQTAPEPEPAAEPEPVAVAKPEPIAETPRAEPQEAVAAAPAKNGRHAANLPPPLVDGDAADLVQEVERILKVKRWDKRKNPFRGFDSPPGRF